MALGLKLLRERFVLYGLVKQESDTKPQRGAVPSHLRGADHERSPVADWHFSIFLGMTDPAPASHRMDEGQKEEDDRDQNDAELFHTDEIRADAIDGDNDFSH
mgnify:CR=1 FL=1